MPTRPDHVDEKIRGYIKDKVPYFFINAKDKDETNVETLNKSTVNKLENIIPSVRINFASVAGHFDYQMLLKNRNAKIDETIIKEYTRLDQNKKWLMNKEEERKPDHKLYVYKIIRDRLLELHKNEHYIADVLIKHLYKKKSKYKATLWECFGAILLDNLNMNLKNMKRCGICSTLINSVSGKRKYCEKCAKEQKKLQTRKSAKISMRKARNKNVKKIERALNP
ncbi:hypothetical protein [Bacillus atrophaeus]|uniref:hypothetical protein n=1 Tax=Bacillus atrophaeus TaxID=1452 RepID=UPI0015E6CBC3|nr:hypothetical protein [Bacillus atrophaeus]